jgi:hypothetical protein
MLKARFNGFAPRAVIGASVAGSAVSTNASSPLFGCSFGLAFVGADFQARFGW